VKVDIKAAFDTIKQDKMLKIVADILDKVAGTSEVQPDRSCWYLSGPWLLHDALLLASATCQ
jgi:hypothetical protein